MPDAPAHTLPAPPTPSRARRLPAATLARADQAAKAAFLRARAAKIEGRELRALVNAARAGDGPALEALRARGLVD